MLEVKQKRFWLKIMTSQGYRANITGKQLERLIEDSLKSKGYTRVNPKEFKDKKNTSIAIFSRNVYVCETIYKTKLKCDFLLYHPVKHADCLIIEAKWQQVSGTVDEKYPYLVENIQKMMPHPTIIVIDGEGYKPGAIEWLRKQVGDNLLYVVNLVGFQKLINSNYF